MPTLHIYNPEHDLALANGSENYTPSARVRSMRKELSLIPALFAAKGDFILLLDPHPLPTPASDLTETLLTHSQQKELKIISPKDLPKLDYTDLHISPWGWDHSLVATLRRAGVPPTTLPTKEWLDQLRNLSHRRTAIKFLNRLAKVTAAPITPATEILTLDEAEDFILSHSQSVFKAPWSSSGHGIQFATPVEAPVILPWIKGIIREQGSVMAEPMYQRNIDWATEWCITPDGPQFLGFSLFRISGRGKYHGNILLPQQKIIDTLLRASARRCDREGLCEIIYEQKLAIAEIIAPTYQGPLGIDLLTTTDGVINPCVEINLRNTMGHASLLLPSAHSQNILL